MWMSLYKSNGFHLNGFTRVSPSIFAMHEKFEFMYAVCVSLFLPRTFISITLCEWTLNWKMEFSILFARRWTPEWNQFSSFFSYQNQSNIWTSAQRVIGHMRRRTQNVCRCLCVCLCVCEQKQRWKESETAFPFHLNKYLTWNESTSAYSFSFATKRIQQWAEGY